MSKNIDTNRYICQAVSSQIIDEEGDKAPQVGIELRVVEGPDAGKTIYWYGSLHENAQQYTFEALRDMGWSCNDVTALEGLGTLKVIAVGKANNHEGKTYQKWMIFPVKTPKPTLEADAKAGFAARFKALAASVAPVKRTDLNAGLPVDALPAKAATNGAGSTARSEGPDASGVPF
jgi:hypothetical protein